MQKIKKEKKTIKHFYKILCIIGILVVSKAEAASQLEWNAWTGNTPLMKISVDDKGHIESSSFKNGALSQTKYFYTDDAYTCAPDLKESFNANCKNTCFPSYKQKGVDFSLGISEEETQKCKIKKIKRGFLGLGRELFSGFKSKTYTLSCPSGVMQITLVPELEKYARFINQSGNTYFQIPLGALKLRGFVAKITTEDQKTKNVLSLYEARNLVIHKDISLIELPKEYLKIPQLDFLTKMDELEDSISQFAVKTKKKLLESKEQKALVKLQAECRRRFPTAKDDAMVITLCREDPKMDQRLAEASNQWRETITRELGNKSQEKFNSGTKTILESFCKK